jgi:hypothetical protein
MAQPSDLMGLGENSFLAARLATLVNNSATATGTSVSTAAAVPATQFLTVVTTNNTGAVNTTNGVVMPVVGGTLGCLLGDDFTVHNGLGVNTAITVYMNSGAGGSSIININGNNTAFFPLAQYHTVTMYPVQVNGTGATNTALWIGLTT